MLTRATNARPLPLSHGVLLVATVALLVPWATYIQIAPWITPVTILVLILGGAQLFYVATERKIRIDTRTLLFSTYIGLLLLSWYWTIDARDWFNSVFWWLICFVTFAGTIWLVRSQDHIRLIVYFGLAGAIIAGTKLQVSTDDWGNILSRRAVSGHNQNFTAYALSGTILVTLVSSALMRFPAWFRLALPPTILAVLYFQAQLGTRGAMISSAAVITLHLSRNYMPRFILNLIPAIALSFSLLVLLGAADGYFMYVDSLFERNADDLSGRTQIWNEALVYIKEYPLLGIGPGSFPSISLSERGAHNFILVILLESGVPGAAIFTLFFFSFFRLFSRMRDRRLGGYLMGIFSAYWFPLISSGHWETSPFSWMIVALFVRLVHMYERSETGIMHREPPVRGLRRIDIQRSQSMAAAMWMKAR